MKPRLFEYDDKNKIVDVFIRRDPDCPFPFHDDDWYHQGFYLDEFISYLEHFFEENDIPYILKKKK
ncbi:MAG: hypothetical protein ACTSQY_00415 [Candidatus Odinarchaeia archaeon]